MKLTLPYDIKWNIAHFIDDIDMRRYFNIYSKIDLDKFKIIHKTIRNNERSHGYYIRYNFQENYENTINRYYNVDGISIICNDLMDTNILMFDDTVQYDISIFKLKKKPFNDYVNKDDIYYKGSLENDYYWQTINIKYSI